MLYNIIDEALEGCVGGEGKFLGGGVGPSDRSERRWSPFLLCDGFWRGFLNLLSICTFRCKILHDM